jgi:hypothetical protein
MTPRAQLTSIDLEPLDPDVTVGDSQQFIATARFNNGSSQDVTALAAWTTSDPSIANITTDGLATGAAAGVTTIQALYGGFSGSTTLSVTVPSLVSITLAPLDPAITLGGSQQFIATGLYSDSTSDDLTAAAVWSSSDPAIATVTTDGLATGAAAGVATIQALYGGISSSTSVSVTAAALVALTVIPASITLQTGMTQQLTALATYDDSSLADVTADVSWSADAPTIAAVDQAGIVTAIAQGAGPIQAAAGVINATMMVNVWTPAPPPSQTSPCILLAQAQQQMLLLMSGQAAVAIETPQLGRVEFSKGSIGDLQRLIDNLNVQCAALTGADTRYLRRRPISIEAWP